ncbi:hypothetical protein NKG94_06845 [Micromonospora sp. M12]
MARAGDVTVVLADAPAGLLYGLFHVVRLCAAAYDPARPPGGTGRRCAGGCSTTGTTWPCTR